MGKELSSIIWLFLFRPLFLYFCFFNAVDTIHKRLAHNWFRTADLWCVGSDHSTYLLTVVTIALYRVLVCKRLCTFYQQWTFDYLLPILNGCIPTTYLHWTFVYLLLTLNVCIPLSILNICILTTYIKHLYTYYLHWEVVYLLPTLNICLPTTHTERLYTYYLHWTVVYLIPTLNVCLPTTYTEQLYTYYLH